MKLRVKTNKKHVVSDHIKNADGSLRTNVKTYTQGMVFEGSADTLRNFPDKFEQVDEKTAVSLCLEEMAKQAPQEEGVAESAKSGKTVSAKS